jgi:hypothetical protein
MHPRVDPFANSVQVSIPGALGGLGEVKSKPRDTALKRSAIGSR